MNNDDRRSPYVPSLLTPTNRDVPHVSLADALQTGSDALLVVDAYRLSQRLQTGQSIGPMTILGVYWLAADLAAKIPPTIHYYSHGFRQEVPTVYLFPGLLVFRLPEVMLGSLTNSAVRMGEKASAFAESVLKLLKSDSYLELGLRSFETLPRGSEAFESALKVGDLVPVSVGDSERRLSNTEYRSTWSDLPESRDPAWNQGEAYRGDYPNGISQPVEQPGMNGNQTFDA